MDGPWLVDVGFGRFSRFPLRLTAPEPQADPEGEFLFLDAPYGDIDVLLDGKPQYRLEQRPRELAEFVPTASLDPAVGATDHEPVRLHDAHRW